MRVIFNIEVKVDIPAHDETRREVFIKLLTQASKQLFTQSAMLCKGLSPTIVMTSQDNDNGEQIHPLFEESPSS